MLAFSGTFASATLSSLGLSSTPGLLGTWSIGSDCIKVYAGPVTATGPLPLLGAGAAFSFSRRLRSRLRRERTSPRG